MRRPALTRAWIGIAYFSFLCAMDSGCPVRRNGQTMELLDRTFFRRAIQQDWLPNPDSLRLLKDLSETTSSYGAVSSERIQDWMETSRKISSYQHGFNFSFLYIKES